METDHSRSSGGHRSTAGDPELIVAARAGDRAAFLVLRHRHEAAALRLAALLVGPGEAATTLTDRAFEQIRGTLESGGGPDCAFRLQVLREVRSAAASTRVAPAAHEQRSGDDHAAAAVPTVRAEADPYVRKSFLALPERWGSVLWHTEVEHQSDAEVAVLLGMRTATVTTLAGRSRDGLLRGYLAGQVHQLDDADCAQVLEHLRRFATGGADAVQEMAVREHLDGCDGCRTAAQTLEILAGDLGAVLAVVVLAEQGIPYLHAVEAGASDPGAAVAVPAGMPARARSMRLVLVAVALVAVTAAVPALRTGAGSEGGLDSLAAAVLGGGGPASQAVVGPSGTGGQAAGPGAGVSGSPTTTAGPTTGRASITTTGVNGLQTRISVSTTTRTGPDGRPITIAVIPGSNGAPATTLTGSVGPSVDGAGNTSAPVFTTDGGVGTSTSPSPTWIVGGAQPTGAAAGAPTGGGVTSWTTEDFTTASGGTAVPTTGAPGPIAPGATASGTTQPPAPGTTTPATTSTTAPAATTEQTPTTRPTDTTTETVTPTTSDDPTTDDPTTSDPTTTDPTTSEPTTTDPTTDEPTSSEPTSSDPAADVVVEPPPFGWIVPLVRTVPSTTVIAIRNRTGVAIHAQTLTVVVPEGISVSADGEASDCSRQDSTTFACAVPPLSESARKRPVSLTLTAGQDAESGDIAVSVTGNQQTGEIRVVL